MPSLKDMQERDNVAPEETIAAPTGPSNDAPIAPTPVDNAPVQESAGTPSEDGPSAAKANPDDPDTSNVSNEEQAELERAMGAMYEVLYNNENTARAVADQLNDQEKVGSVAKTSLLVVQQIDEKLDIDEEILAQFILNTVNEVLEIAESKGINLSEAEREQALATTWEGALITFGGEQPIQPDYDSLTEGMSEEQIQSAKGMAQSLLDEGEPAENLAAPGGAPAQAGPAAAAPTPAGPAAPAPAAPAAPAPQPGVV